MSACFKNGIKVYPVRKNGSWRVQSQFNGRKKTFDKDLKTTKELNEALTKTYKYYYNKL